MPDVYSSADPSTGERHLRDSQGQEVCLRGRCRREMGVPVGVEDRSYWVDQPKYSSSDDDRALTFPLRSTTGKEIRVWGGREEASKTATSNTEFIYVGFTPGFGERDRRGGSDKESGHLGVPEKQNRAHVPENFHNEVTGEDAYNMIWCGMMKGNQTMVNLSETIAANETAVVVGAVSDDCHVQGRKCQYGSRLTSSRTSLGTGVECDGQ